MPVQRIPDLFFGPVEHRAPCIYVPCLFAVSSIASMGFELVIACSIGAFFTTLACNKEDFLVVKAVLVI